MNPFLSRRTFLTVNSSAILASRLAASEADGKDSTGPQLLVVSALGPDHPLIQSMISQLLEQGIWFDFDHDQHLPAKLPEDFERYHALLLDSPAVEVVLKDKVLRTRLDTFAKEGGFVFRLEAAAVSDSKSTLDLTNDPRYLDRADALAAQSIELFLPDDCPLPKASHKHDHYEAVTRGDSLMMSLLQLRAVHQNPPPKLLLVYTDR